MGLLLDDVNDGLDLFLIHANQNGHVARHQEAAGGGQLGGRESVLGQRLGDRIGVVMVDDCKDQFHK